MSNRETQTTTVFYYEARFGDSSKWERLSGYYENEPQAWTLMKASRERTRKRGEEAVYRVRRKESVVTTVTLKEKS